MDSRYIDRMRRRHVPLLAVCALLLALPSVRSQQTSQPTSQPTHDAIDETILRQIDRGVAQGVVTLVEHKGELIHASAHGDAAPAKPMTRDAVFRIYSMTKPITAVAAMLLVEEEKLALDDPITKHLPKLANLETVDGEDLEREITVRDLLCHTSGFVYGFNAGELTPLYRRARIMQADDLPAMVERLATVPTAHQPGVKWSYGVSTDVLGAVIELASETPLDEFFAKRIFEPLGMKDTGFFVREDQRERFTATYSARGAVMDEPGKSEFLKQDRLRSGGGGLVSTADDYLKFARMLARGGEPILEKSTVAAMTKNQLDDALVPIAIFGMPMPGTGFGLGMSVKVEEDFPGSLGEYGWSGAATTSFSVAPEAELIVITMAQRMPLTPMLHVMARSAAFGMIE